MPAPDEGRACAALIRRGELRRPIRQSACATKRTGVAARNRAATPVRDPEGL